MTTAEITQAVFAGLQAVLTTALVFLTSKYARITGQILQANEGVVTAMRVERESRERENAARLRPRVQIATFTLPHDICIYLRIENIGPTAALNLRLLLDQPFHLYGDPAPKYALASIPAFAETSKSFAPGMKLTYMLDTAIGLFNPRKPDAGPTPLVFAVTAEYEWDSGRAREMTVIDLRPYEMSHMEHHPIVEELKHITEGLKKVKDAVEKLEPPRRLRR
jgi:hypothetical protein